MDLVDAALRRTRLPPDAAAVARLGRRVAAQYFAWRHGLDLNALVDCMAARAGLAPASPLLRTAHATVAALLRWGGHPYHSITHHAEVATSAMLLAALAPATVTPLPLAKGLLFCAALAHDLDFDPAQAALARYAAERRSADALDRIAAQAGVAEPERQTLRLLILATEPLARAGLRDLLRDGTPHPDPELKVLATRPDVCDLAAILSDADLLSSSALNEVWQATQQHRLGEEWGRPVTQDDQIMFFRDILGAGYLSPGGRVFFPNLLRIRAAALATAL